MNTEEFAAFCAELAAKREDGRALQEAVERLAASRLRRLHDPELILDSEYEKDLNEEAEVQGVDVKAARAGLQDDVSDLLTPRRQSGGGL
jgi:hypothetical protein